MVWSVSAPAGFGVRLGVATVWAGPLSSTHFVDKPELFHCTWRARLWHWTGFGLGEWARVRLRAGTRVGTWLRSWYTSLMLLFFILYLLFILIIVFHFWYFLCNIPTISWLVWYLNSDHNWVADTLASLGVKIFVDGFWGRKRGSSTFTVSSHWLKPWWAAILTCSYWQLYHVSYLFPLVCWRCWLCETTSAMCTPSMFLLPEI